MTGSSDDRREPVGDDPERLCEAIESADHFGRHALLRRLVGQRVSSRYLERLLASPDANLRRAVVARVGGRALQRLEPTLIELLRDGSGSVRGEAARRLGELGSQAAIGGICDLAGARDPDERKTALRALSRIGGRAATDALVTALHDRDESVRLAAIDGLERVRDRRAVDGLLGVLGDASEGVRFRALMVLAALEARGVESSVVPLLQDGSARVREYATRALFGAEGDAAADALVNALSDAVPEVRCAAAEAMGTLARGSRIRRALQDATAREANSTVRSYLADALRRTGESAPPRVARRTPRRERLFRSWYTWPSLDAASWIWAFRADGTGEVEDFAMGVTRRRATFTYGRDGRTLTIRFGARAGPVRTSFRIDRAHFDDPSGKIPCYRLTFAREPFFTSEVDGPSIYYSPLAPDER